jgi:hypothetical protein
MVHRLRNQRRRARHGCCREASPGQARSGFVDGVRAVRGEEVGDDGRDDRRARADEFCNSVERGIRNPDISGAIDGDAEGDIQPSLVAGGGGDGGAGGVELADGAVGVWRLDLVACAIDHPDIACAVDGDALGNIEAAAGVSRGTGDGRTGGAKLADAVRARSTVRYPDVAGGIDGEAPGIVEPAASITSGSGNGRAAGVEFTEGAESDAIGYPDIAGGVDGEGNGIIADAAAGVTGGTGNGQAGGADSLRLEPTLFTTQTSPSWSKAMA